VLDRRDGAGRVDIVESALPADVSGRVELDRQRRQQGNPRARVRAVTQQADRDVAPVDRLLAGVEVGHLAARRSELPLPLDVADAVQLHDQRAGSLVRVGRVADGDIAAVARLLDLLEHRRVIAGLVGLRPDDRPRAVDLLDQAACEPAQLRTNVARAAADRATGKDVAAVARLPQRGRDRIIAGCAPEAAKLLLPLRRANGARLQQPRRPSAPVRGRRVGARQRQPATIRSGLHILGVKGVLDAVQHVRVVLHVHARRRETAAAAAVGRLLSTRARRRQQHGHNDGYDKSRPTQRQDAELHRIILPRDEAVPG